MFSRINTSNKAKKKKAKAKKRSNNESDEDLFVKRPVEKRSKKYPAKKPPANTTKRPSTIPHHFFVPANREDTKMPPVKKKKTLSKKRTVKDASIDADSNDWLDTKMPPAKKKKTSSKKRAVKDASIDADSNDDNISFIENHIVVKSTSEYGDSEIWTGVDKESIPDKTFILPDQRYYVSSHARFVSVINRTNKQLRTYKKQLHMLTKFKPHGRYHDVCLSDGKGRSTNVRVNRITCWAFDGAPKDENMHADHIDPEDVLNNCIWNLQWLSPIENRQKQRKRQFQRNPDD